MQFKAVRWLCVAITATGAASTLLPAQTKIQKNRTVIVISLDGFPAYALDDPRLPIPTLRKLAREGVAAASMRPVNPTVTWPNHTAIVTGVDASEHHVLVNGLLTPPTATTPPKIEMWRDKEDMVHAPTVYDLAYQAGLTTAQVDWVAIYGAKTITWKFPELPDPNGPIEKELIAAGTVTADQLRTFEDSSQVWQDQMWTNAAVQILEKHTPNLLLFHLLTLDNENHEYAPMSSASFTAMAFLDDRVNQILDALQRNHLTERTTVIIVSDHGFRAIKHKIHGNALLRQKGFKSQEGGQMRASAWVQPAGGIAMVWAVDRKAEVISRLRETFGQAEGIERIYGADDLPVLGFPTAAQDSEAPDLVLAAKPDYGFSDEAGDDFITNIPEAGTHGFLNSDPKMQAIFLAWGNSVPKGVQINSISNLDVAPTIAALLGFEMKQAKGHAIPEIARQAASK